MSDVLSRLHEKEAECRRLHELIHQRVKQRELTGLLSEVETLLVLQPDRKDAVKLKDELIERDRKLAETRDVAVIEARRLFELQEYEACLMELRRIDSSVMQQDAIELREQAKAHHDRLHTLRQFINEAVHAKQFDGLLKKVDEYLTLRSDDAEFQILRERLVARDEKNAAKVVNVLEKARSLRQKCRFEAASKSLQRIPLELQTQQVIDLLEDCDCLASLRQSALSVLQQAVETRDYELGRDATHEYRDSLRLGELEDDEFHSRFLICGQALQLRREAAECQRAAAIKRSLAAAIVITALLVGGGFWLRARQQAQALADAVQQQNWDEALTIDGQHVPASIDGADQRLSAATPEELAQVKQAAAKHIKAWLEDVESEVHIGDGVNLDMRIKYTVETGDVLAVESQGADSEHALIGSLPITISVDLKLSSKGRPDTWAIAEFFTFNAEVIKSADTSAWDINLTEEKFRAGLLKTSSSFEETVSKMTVQHLAGEIEPSAVSESEPPRRLSNSPASIPKTLASQKLSSALAEGVQNSIGMEFKLIPGGRFTMGSADGEFETPHEVTLTRSFELGVYEVTQEQYEAVMGTTLSYFKGPQNPAENVSWDEAVEFCRKLSELPAEKSAGYEYRLPTEAEWECACRAGTKTQYSFGDSASELGAYEWYGENSGKTTHPVGGKKPNAWGLYDMHGNVWEWCQDWHGDYPSGSVTDPTGAGWGSLRVSRGGCWSSFARRCRSAFRLWSTPDYRFYYLGFRVLRSSIK
jgi:formylglycine-generating enzyme required for sulfatase activity